MERDTQLSNWNVKNLLQVYAISCYTIAPEKKKKIQWDFFTPTPLVSVEKLSLHVLKLKENNFAHIFYQIFINKYINLFLN